MPIDLVDPKTGKLYEAADDAEAEKQIQAYGVERATPEQVAEFQLQKQYGGAGDKLDAFVETVAATGGELAEAASKHGLGQAQDPNTGAPIGPTNIDPLTGQTRPGVAQEASKLVPFAYTEAAKKKREANPNTTAAAVVAPDLITSLLIPGAGVAGMAASAVLSGAITEAGASVIDGSEFSVKDMMMATGGAFALDAIGTGLITQAMKVTGKGRKSYVDAAIDRARKAGADDALQEVDAAARGPKLRRNDEAAYERLQTDLDETMNAIDARVAEAPDAVLTPQALKRSVSANVGAQEDAFLDLAVKLDHAVQVADEVPGLSSARDALQNTLGKPGHEMFAAMNTAKRELEALGSDSPLVQEAIEALDSSLRSERTWGRAAKTYAEVADEGVAPVGSWNVRDLEGREALDARLDRARARAIATGDKQLAKQVTRAEKVMEKADKVTGARLLADTTPDDVAKLKKQVEGFEKRGPKLAKELSAAMQKLEKRLGAGVIPSATEDDALDYIAARVHGLGGGRDPLKAVLQQAEKHLDGLKAKGASHIEVARAQSEINTLREAVDEINDVPRAARRVRQYEAHPSRLAEKAKAEADSVVTDELENALQPVIHGSGAAIGGAMFGVPGYIGGYLLGRAANKKFGSKIAKYAWGKAKNNIAKEAVKSPGQAVAGGIGALGGLVMGHGNPAVVAGGFYAGRKAGEMAGRGVRKIFTKGKAVAKEAAAEVKAAAKAGVDEVTAATPKRGKLTHADTKPVSKAQEAAEKDYYDRLNKAHHAAQNAEGEAKAAADAEYQKILAEGLPKPKPGLAARVKGAVVDAVKKDPHKALGAALTPGAAYAASQAEGDGETAGAAAASAGLLLLLLPRSMGRRMAMETLEEASRNIARALPSAEVGKIARVLEETAPDAKSLLRGAVRDSSGRWSPEDLLNAQTAKVDEAFAVMFPGQVITPEAERYVRAELWRRNAVHVGMDDELNAAYEGAVRQANETDAYNARVTREDAPAAAPVEYPSDRARVMDRSSELRPEQVQRLERSAINAVNALPEEGRQMLRSLFSRTGDELREMSQRFIDDPTAFRSAEDLLDAQAEVLRREFELQGGSLGAGRGDAVAEAAEQAALAEIQSYNATQALRAREAVAERLTTPDEPFSGSTPPRTSAATTDAATQRRRIEGFEPMGSFRQLGDETEAIYTRMRQRGMEPQENLDIRAAFDGADDELRAMQQAFVRGEPHMRDGEIVMNVNNQAALVQHQRQVLRDAWAGAVGARADQVPRDIEQLIELEVTRRNGRNALDIEPVGGQSVADARQTEREARRADLERRRADREHRRETNQLKNPDAELDEHAALIEGMDANAATRLDDALHPHLERINVADGDSSGRFRQDLDEAARQFVRDNPGMVSEEDALAYAERRWDTMHNDLDAAEDLLEAGGHARLERLPGFDEIEEEVQEKLYEAFDEQVHRVDVSDEWESNNARFDFREFRRDMLENISHHNPRQRRQAEAWLDEQEDALSRSFDEQVSENRSEWEAENAPDSTPSSSQRSHGYEPEDAGLPSADELRDAGMTSTDINHVEGIRNVFGRELTTEEVEGIFSLEHLKKYADSSGTPLETQLTVTRNAVEFEGSAGGGDFKIHTIYRNGGDGMEIYYRFLHVPEELQASGAAKDLIRQMVAPLEDLGAKSVTVSAAWIGQYSWIKLGLRPNEYAERKLFDAFESRLKEVLDPGMRDQAAQFVMGKIKNSRDVADTYLPMNLVKDRLPELRQGWEELMAQYSLQDVKTIPFEEACFRTSRSGNEQFLAGKYFLLTHPGDWNSGLKLDIQPGAPWYDEFKGRLGLMGAGVGALSMYELIGAFNQTEMDVSGTSEADKAADLPPEVEAYVEEQRQKSEQVEATRERLGYLKTQSETLMQTAARSLANRSAKERTVEAIPGVTTNQGIKSFMGSNATVREAYEEKRETLEKLQQNPMLLVDELTEGLAELQDTAPELHAKMVAQTYKIVNYLQSKVPTTVGVSLARPKGSPPNDLALKQFALYYSAATDPSSVLGDLSNNRARREQVDTLKEVWGEEIYVPLKGKIVAEMASGKATVNQRIRLDLLFDFGDSLDTGMSSRLLAASAQAHEKKEASQGGGEHGDQGGAPGKVPGRKTQPSVMGTSPNASLYRGAAAPA